MDADREYLAAGRVLGGLSESEQAEADRLWAQDESFREEVASFEETMGLLAATDEPVVPSDDVERAILEIPAATGQTAAEPGAVREQGTSAADEASAGTVGARTRPPRRGPAMLFALAASVLLLVAVVLGGVALDAHQDRQDLQAQVEEMESQRQQAESLLGAPDLDTRRMETPDGAQVTLSYSVEQQAMMVMPHQVEDPGESEDLQMWIIDEDGAHDVGLMSAQGPSMVTGQDFGESATFGVTLEPEGGSPQPTSDPVMVAEL
ncbi:anti-sigma factor domain-containing protein [Nesterenkonia sp. F]|uniref:anti-sigma factor n=1 Tax=Nesterenkonia sp. F TaxID=795955 RepID=UPI000255CAE5|nr:anti-sigma factor [Nesterenkonia sp. F]